MLIGDNKGLRSIFTGAIKRGNDCELCCESVSPESMKSYCSSGHFACNDCWISHFKAIGPRNLRCIQKCITFDVKKSTEIMDSIRYEPWITIKNFYDLYFQMNDPDHILCLCQNPICNTAESVFMIEKGSGWTQCGHCKLPVCNLCKQIAHHNQPCKTSHFESTLVSANLNRIIYVNDTRMCFCCGATLNKISGCDKVRCSCGYTFCWGCYSPWWESHMDQIHVKDDFLAVGDPLFIGPASPLTFLHKNEVVPYYTNILLCLFNLGISDENKGASLAVIHLLFNIGGIEFYFPFNTGISTLVNHSENPPIIFISIFYVSVLIKLCYFAMTISGPLTIDYDKLRKCITIALSKKESPPILFLKERLEQKVKRTENDVIEIIREMMAMKAFPGVEDSVKTNGAHSLIQAPKGMKIDEPRSYRIFTETHMNNQRVISVLKRDAAKVHVDPEFARTGESRLLRYISRGINATEKPAEKPVEKPKRTLEVVEIIDKNKHQKLDPIASGLDANGLRAVKSGMLMKDVIERVCRLDDYEERMKDLNTVIKEVEELKKKFVLK